MSVRCYCCDASLTDSMSSYREGIVNRKHSYSNRMHHDTKTGNYYCADCIIYIKDTIKDNHKRDRIRKYGQTTEG